VDHAVAPTAPPAAAAASDDPAEPSTPAAQEPAEPESQQPPEPEPSDKPDPPAGQSGSDLDLDQVIRIWPAVLDRLRQSKNPALAAAFEGARPIAIDPAEATVTIGFPANSTFNKRKAEGPEKREQLAAALEAVAAERLTPIYEMLDGETASDELSAVKEQVDTDALVERIKSEFDAEEVS
jgi:hypothetical protein